jgi:hypothetical protein
VDFDVDAFGVALDLLLSAFPGFKRVIVLDEDRLIEGELLVAE